MIGRLWVCTRFVVYVGGFTVATLVAAAIGIPVYVLTGRNAFVIADWFGDRMVDAIT